MRRRLPILGLLLCLGAWTQQAPPTVGFVLSIDGPWQVQGRALRQGEAVPAGVRVLLAAGTTFDPNPAAGAVVNTKRTYWIDIVLLDGEHKSLRCSSAQACRAGLLMPGSVVPQTTLASRLGDVFRLIFSSPERYVGLMSRGSDAGRAGFVDGVAKFEAGRLLFSSFFRGLPAATYLVQLERVPAAPAAAPLPDLNIAWDRSASSAAPQTALTPGLYRMTLRRDSDPAFGPFESWILVTTATDFAATATAFDDAMRVTRTWDRNVPAKDVAIFRHAYLTHLASRR